MTVTELLDVLLALEEKYSDATVGFLKYNGGDDEFVTIAEAVPCGNDTILFYVKYTEEQ